MKAQIISLKIIMVMALVACGLWVLAIAHSTHPAAKPVAAVAAPCSTRTNLCIELDEADGGVVARFNDFRFNGQCVMYRVLPPDQWQQYCGAGYKLKWVGPDNTATHST